jgi:hypothetical protein
MGVASSRMDVNATLHGFDSKNPIKNGKCWFFRHSLRIVAGQMQVSVSFGCKNPSKGIAVSADNDLLLRACAEYYARSPVIYSRKWPSGSTHF